MSGVPGSGQVALKVPLIDYIRSNLTPKHVPDLGAPLRNRTVDLLLTIDRSSFPSSQVRASDQAEREPTRAQTSPGHAHASTVCHSICHSL